MGLAGIGLVSRMVLGASSDFWRHGVLTLTVSLAFFSLLSFFTLVLLPLSLPAA